MNTRFKRFEAWVKEQAENAQAAADSFGIQMETSVTEEDKEMFRNAMHLEAGKASAYRDVWNHFPAVSTLSEDKGPYEHEWVFVLVVGLLATIMVCGLVMLVLVSEGAVI